MVQLLNQPRDNIEGLLSLGFFIFLYTIYVEIIYGNSADSFLERGWPYFISRIIVMAILYLLWFYGSRVITNYIFFFNSQDKQA